MGDRLVRIKESAHQLDLSERTLWDWVYKRKIEVVRLGRSVRIKQSLIDQLIERGTTPAKASNLSGAIRPAKKKVRPCAVNPAPRELPGPASSRARRLRRDLSTATNA